MGRRDAVAIAAIWVVAAAVQVAAYWKLYGSGSFPDPDDALRLVQVRDWLAGQGWFDVTQFRIFPPSGVVMHWSRLVDVPVGGAILFFNLFMPSGAAETAALVIVPLLIHVVFLSGIYLLALRVGGERRLAILACALAALAIGIAVQFRPMRIDHHGWQIALTILAVALCFGTRPSIRDTCASGALMALALTVSIECLPVAITLTGILVLRVVRDAGEIRALNAFLGSMTLAALLLLLATTKLDGLSQPVCDAMSIVYLVPLIVFAVGVFAVSRGTLPSTPAGRIALFGALALLAAGAGLAAGRPCLGGLMSPLIRDAWYENIKEGLPIWQQRLPNASISLLSSVLGIAGSLGAALRADPLRRWGWIELLLLLIAAVTVSLQVNRAMAVAHSLAVVGNAWLLLHGFAWALQRRHMVGRIGGSLACLLLVPQIGVLAAFITVFRILGVTPDVPADAPPCFASSSVRVLDALAPGLIFAPLDVGPAILVNTPRHSVVATGHHRNARGIVAVTSGFAAAPDEARSIISGTGARYLLVCRALPEFRSIVADNPHSLAATLDAGTPPDWLKPLTTSADTYSVYEVASNPKLAQ